ncbi:MAG: glycosyltransferase [Alphaproteobacteria bacterium]|nr:MAG: glycosyltransferase [Alphaproteobacteria bacterium]
MIILRPLWRRRYGMLRRIRFVSGWLLKNLGMLPLSPRVKMAIHDIMMLAISSLIVQSRTYQAWQTSASGTRRVQRLLAGDKDTQLPDALLPYAPYAELWDALEARPMREDVPCIDVIIPVYRDYDQSLNAMYRAIETRIHNKTPYRVVVINDCSPDAQLTEALRSLAQRHLFTLMENQENLGFVKTVNKAMRLEPSRDVVLLNSDTEVYHDWLDRMIAASASHPRVATITPFSNNAEICSYPYFVRANMMALECEYATLDSLAAHVNHGAVVAVPTGIGFCMWIARAALDVVGYFDEEHFGKGYGEENDFCCRTTAHGFVHLMACDVFVRHVGGSSFGSSKNKLIAKNYQILCGLHPEYHGQVQDILRRDPMAIYRQALDVARIDAYWQSQHYTKGAIMMVNHTLGGGTERHMREMIASCAGDAIPCIILTRDPDDEDVLMLHVEGVQPTPNLSFRMSHDHAAMLDVLRRLNIRHMHVHHLIHFPSRIMEYLRSLSHDLGIAYDMTLHDYFPICPRVNLIDDSGYYCGEPAVTTCEQCVRSHYSFVGNHSVWEWRFRYAEFLGQARRVFVPSEDMHQRMMQHMPHLNYAVRVHAERFDDVPLARTMPRMHGERLRVAVVGALSRIKGSAVLEALVRDVAGRDCAIDYTIIGYTDNAALTKGLPHCHVTGAYKEHEIGQYLEDVAPHLILIPSLWPETYCYALSIAWRFGIRPVVFDIGAPAERVRALGAEGGDVLPYAWVHEPQRINDWLAQQGYHSQPLVRPETVTYASMQDDYYGELVL